MKLWIVLVLLLEERVLLSAQSAGFNQSIPEGGDVTVPCENEGRVSWSKLFDGKREIVFTAQHEQAPVKHKPDPDHRYRVLPDLSLLIKEASWSDSGIYYCNATPVLDLKVTPVKGGPTVKPSVSLLPPSPLQLSEGSASLLCQLSAYSPQGALVSWTVDGTEVKDGVLTGAEEEKSGRYSRSSTLTLSKDLWEKGEEFTCRVSHDNADHLVAFRKSQCEDERIPE